MPNAAADRPRPSKEMAALNVKIITTVRRLAALAAKRAISHNPQNGLRGKIIDVSCWSHARWKFFDVREQWPRLAHEALARISALHQLEGELKQLCDTEWHELPR